VLCTYGASKAPWSNFSVIKKTFNSADSVGNSWFVFNVKVNHYWVVVRIVFSFKTIYLRLVGNHKEYSKLKDIDKNK
jgi:mRNA interferase HigB